MIRRTRAWTASWPTSTPPWRRPAWGARSSPSGRAALSLATVGAAAGQPLSIQFTAGDPTGTVLGFISGQVALPSGDASVRLVASAHLGSFTATSSPSSPAIIISGTPFGGSTPTVAVNPNFAGVDGFATLTPQEMLGLFDQFGGWLDNLQSSPSLAVTLPLVGGQTVGSLLDLKQAFETAVTNAMTVAPPATAPIVAAVGGGATGGNLAPGTYFIEYTFTNAAGAETATSPESLPFTVAAGDVPKVTLPALPMGITGYKLYLGSSPGGPTTFYASGVGPSVLSGASSFTVNLSGAAVANGSTPPAGSTTMPAFGTAQDLAAALAAALDVPASSIDPNYDPTSHELTFHITASTTLPAVSGSLALGSSLGALGGVVQTGGTVSLTPSVSFDTILGIDLSSATIQGISAAPTQGFLAEGASFQLSLGGGHPVTISLAATPAIASKTPPANGQLSGNVHFTLTVGSAAPVAVTVAQDPNNSSLSDLVNDINAALGQAGLGLSVIARDLGGVLSLWPIGNAVGSALTIQIQAGDPAATSLGFVDGQTTSTPDPSIADLVNEINAAISTTALAKEVTAGYSVSAPAMIASTTAPADGQLSGDAHFTLTLGSRAPIAVTVASVANNTSLSALVNDINAALAPALAAAGESNDVVAGLDGSSVTLSTAGDALPLPLTIHITPGDPAATSLGFSDDQSSSPTALLTLAPSATAATSDLVIHANPLDLQSPPTVDTLGFQDGQTAVAGTLFVRNPSISGSIQLTASGLNASAQLGFLGIGVVNGQGTAVANVSLQLTDPQQAGDTGASNRINLSTLQAALSGIVLTASSEAPGDGQLQGVGTFQVTLGSGAPVSVTVTTPSTNATLDDLVNDINSGLAAANLASLVVAGRVGGHLRLSTKGLGVAPSLTIAVAPGDPATALGFASGQSASDLLASTRYTVTASQPVPSNVQIGGSANFTITVGSGSPVAVTVKTNPTDATIDDLVRDVNAGLVAAGLGTEFFAGRAGSNLTLTAWGVNASGFTLHVESGDPAGSVLGFADGQAAITPWSSVVPTYVLTAANAGPADGTIGQASDFTIQLGSGSPVAVDVPAVAGNTSLDDLIAELNTALEAAGLGGKVVAGSDGSQLTVTTSGFGAMPVTIASDPANNPESTDLLNLLGFHDGQVSDSPTFAPTITGDAHLTLPIQVKPDPLALIAPGTTPVISLTWANLADPSSLDLSYNSAMDRLLELRDVSAGDIIQGLTQVGDYLSNLSVSGALAAKLPVLNESIGDIVGFAGQFQTWVGSFADDPGATVQTLLQQLDEAFDVPTGSPLISLGLDDAEIVASAAGTLSGTGHFTLTLGSGAPVSVTVTSTTSNPSLAALVGDLDAGLDAAGLAGSVVAGVVGDALSLLTTGAAAASSLVVQIASGDPAAALGFADGQAAEAAIKLSLNLQDSVNTTLPVDLNLTPLKIAGATNLFDAHDSAPVKVQADADLSLAVGFDLNAGGSPVPFLYDSSSLKFDAKVSGTDLNFSAAVGPLGLFIEGGSVELNDGTSDQGPAVFQVTMVPSPGTAGRISLSSLTPSSVVVTLTGQANATLPVYFPTSSTPLGGEPPTNDIELNVGDLGDIADTTTLTGPPLGSAISGIDVSTDLDAVEEGWDQVISFLSGVLDTNILGSELPMVGKSLGQAIAFLNNLHDTVLDQLEAQAGASAEALGTLAVQTALVERWGRRTGVAAGGEREGGDLARRCNGHHHARRWRRVRTEPEGLAILDVVGGIQRRHPGARVESQRRREGGLHVHPPVRLRRRQDRRVLRRHE